jgi:hypothetical protein
MTQQVMHKSRPRKQSGVAVLAIIAAVAAAAVVYIASFGRSGHHAQADTPRNEAVASQGDNAAFAIAPLRAASEPGSTTAAR